MREETLFEIIKELGETIDTVLLPQTAVSSLGLKLAIKTKSKLNDAMRREVGLSKQESFVKVMRDILISEFDYMVAPEILSDTCIRLTIQNCPLKRIRSGSLCTIMQGIAGGLAFMAFGYCKIVPVSGPSQPLKPCCLDLYIEASPEALGKLGTEYSKDNIVLMQTDDAELIANQRNERRKTLLGLFNNLSFSMQQYRSSRELANSFIESLSCISDIGIAALYLKEGVKENYTLAAHFGLREEIAPLVSRIGAELDFVYNSTEDVIKLNDEMSWADLGVCRRTVRSFTVFKLRFEDRLIGLLHIGWKSAIPVSPELSESLRAACFLLGAIIDNSRLYFELEKSYMDNVGLIDRMAKVTDRFLQDHSKRVAELSEAIALQMGFPQDEATLLYQAGVMHDIGKITIPPEILSKAGKLTEEEYKLVKEHPATSAQILSPITMYKSMIPAVLYHHERLDGSGYPKGLVGDKIPVRARIIAVADVYDAMTSKRAHRDAIQIEETIYELTAGKGIKYDPDVVNALIDVLRAKGVVRNLPCTA